AEMLAEQIIKHIGKVGPIKYGTPKHARFVVLTAAEIPSVLVELDYISNPRRERLLKSKGHQDRLASALLDASRTFLKKQGRLPLKAKRKSLKRDEMQVRRTETFRRPAS
ncbi:MAG: N-acetylmuramoyl-L-alanine amidase, partial [Mariprofundaceae bacterium]|nr:N-acetylmuramoyl-L-alanine amidase [Mariprofundaceae bacterium]